MKVVHQGHSWRVTRRWVPWRRRTKGWIGEALGGGPDVPTLGDDPISLVIGAVLLLVALPFIVIALLAGVVAIVELALLAVVFPFALLARVLLGRHWVVEIRRGFRPYYEEDAGDWAGSRERIHLLAEQIERGDLPPANLGEPPARDAR